MDGAYIDCVMRCDPCGGAVEDDDGHLKERGGGKVNRVKRRLCQEAENELQNGKTEKWHILK